MSKRGRWKFGADTKHELYNLYIAMIHRCCDPQNPHYADYGQRGICVCPEWMPDPEGSGQGWRNFIADMGPRPSGKYRKKVRRRKPKWSVERVDNDGDYCNENCVWSTTSSQQRNRRNWRWGEGFKLIRVRGT